VTRTCANPLGIVGYGPTDRQWWVRRTVANMTKALTFVRAFSSCLNYVSEGGLEPPFPAKGTSTSS
jgi:hypothetical protein